MIMRVTMHDQKRLIEWGEQRMGLVHGGAPAETRALGVFDEQAELHAVIWFNAFYGRQASLHVASNGQKLWATRRVFQMVFSYAFDRIPGALGLDRLEFRVSVENLPVQILALKSGLRIEGVARCGAEDGNDAIVMGMLAKDCHWLPPQVKERING